MKQQKTSIFIRSSFVGVAVNLLLFFIKLSIGLSSNSVAVFADSLNNLLDCAVCGVAVGGFALMRAKPGESYPFGYGKAEELLAFIVSVAAAGTGLYFVYLSLSHFMYPTPVWFSVRYALIIAATLPVKLLLAVMFNRINRSNGSQVIRGLWVDSLIDFFITLCTLISFTLNDRVGFSIDGVTGVAVGAVLAGQGVKMTVSACRTLLNKQNAEETVFVRNILEKSEGVKQVHRVYCIGFGEKKVYLAEITVNDSASDELNIISQNIKSRTGSDIFFNFGGTT